MKRQPVRRYLPPALLCWSVACGPPEPGYSGSGIIGDIASPNEPEIVVELAELDFDLVSTQPGAGISVGQADGAFDIGPIESVVVPVDSRRFFIVSFEPTDDVAYEDVVYVESDAPNGPVAQVFLFGEGQDPVVAHDW